MLARNLFILACLAVMSSPLKAQSVPAQQPGQTNPAASTSQPAKTAPVPTTKSAATAPTQVKPVVKAPAVQTVKPQAAKPQAPKLPSRVTEAELSGIFTNQLSDTLFARLRLERRNADRLWYLRTSYATTSTDTVSGSRIVTTTTSATRLDSEYRKTRDGHYDFLAAAYNLRGRSPANKTYPARSGYYLLYGGRGKPLGPKAEGGLGPGLLYDYDDGSSTKPALVAYVQGSTPISKRLTLDGRVLFVRPIDISVKLDGESSLQYQLMQGLFLRLGYTTTNLVRSTLNNGDWNSAWRLSLLFRHSR